MYKCPWWYWLCSLLLRSVLRQPPLPGCQRGGCTENVGACWLHAFWGAHSECFVRFGLCIKAQWCTILHCNPSTNKKNLYSHYKLKKKSALCVQESSDFLKNYLHSTKSKEIGTQIYNNKIIYIMILFSHYIFLQSACRTFLASGFNT